MSATSTEATAPVAGSRRHELLRRVTAAVLILTMLLVALIPHLPSFMHLIFIPDFTMLWTGGRFALESPSLLYDADAVTAAQQWIRDSKRGPLPWIYPPTTLLLVVPFALMPFWPAYILWTVAGVVAFWTAARRVTSGWVAVLALLSPPAMLVLMLGQTTLLVGAAVLWSIALLRERPVLAGVLMGVAAAIKPQSAILAPIAYISERNWTALIATACTWLLLATASLAFGPTLWLDWIHALPGFPEMIEQWKLDRHGATPVMMARFFGIDPTAFLAGGIAAGVISVWVGIKSDDVKARALTFVGGTLLASPYAMNYELTMMAPMLVAAMLTTTLVGLIIAVPLVASRVYAIAPALLISVVATLWKARSSSSREPLTGESRQCGGRG